LGLSPSANLEYISTLDFDEPFVLDGWHLSDPVGELMPPNVCVYVIYADYDLVIDRYRVPVRQRSDHWSMFKTWYGADFTVFPRVRYIRNQASFAETTAAEFESWRSRSLG
jgi:hypothetical protein